MTLPPCLATGLRRVIASTAMQWMTRLQQQQQQEEQEQQHVVGKLVTEVFNGNGSWMAVLREAKLWLARSPVHKQKPRVLMRH